jgi:hypothetical protein
VAVETPNFGKRFANAWPRWYLWIVFLGVGYHVGQFLSLTLSGRFSTGLVDLATGIVGYLLLGVLYAIIIALTAAALPKVRIAPTTIGWGIVRAFAVGLPFGLVSPFLSQMP